jgi:CheY-like chemotaxis protein
VLCIDNEPKVLEGMEALLQRWGCRVLAARDLDAARAALRAAPGPDGLLVDYHLDAGNGLDAIAALQDELPHLPAVLITADRGPEVRRAAAEAGVRVLNKPVKPAALRALLAQWRVQKIAAE